MASTYYDSAGKEVVDGDVAYASDLNDINTAVNTAFEQVETDIGTLGANQIYFADLAEKWATEAEDVEVEPGKYSAYHWAQKAEDDATATAADRVQTGLDRTAASNSASAASGSALAASNSATAASNSATTALGHANTALGHANTALGHANTAAGYASDASDYADDAAASAALFPILSAADEGKYLLVDTPYTNGITTAAITIPPDLDYIVDGDFNFWFEATSQTSSGYGSDTMWRNLHNGSTKTHSLQTTALGGSGVTGDPKFFSRTVVTSVAGASNYVFKQHRIEGVRRLGGKTVTLSFWAYADAPKNMAVEFIQSFGTGGAPSSPVYGIGATKVALTTGFAKYSITVALPSVISKTLGSDNNDNTAINLCFDAGSSYNARTDSLGQQSGTFNIARVRLVEGEVDGDDIEHDPAEELARVQRYYEQSFDGTTPADRIGEIKVTIDQLPASPHSGSIPVRTEKKRGVPVVTVYSIAGTSGNVRDLAAGADVASTIANTGSSGFTVNTGNVASGTTYSVAFHYKADARL